MFDHRQTHNPFRFGTGRTVPMPGQIPRKDAGGTLRIGLMNNMPDSAFRQTEQQFRRLVSPHAELKLFALDGMARGEQVAAEIAVRYQPHSALPMAGLDALVITGSEPVAARLQDEPFFKPLGDVLSWAATNVTSTLMSCLASHAAVLHFDGIARTPLGGKCSGVFPCAPTEMAHPLLGGLPAQTPVPHSRWNGLDEAALVRKGYQILRRSDAIGVDVFVRDADSLMVFLQGHPEYDADSLAREYRRDVGRYLNGARSDYPAMPQNCFTAEGAARFAAFEARALERRDPALFASFPDLVNALPDRPAWQADAALLFRNWIADVARRRRNARARRVI